MQITLEGRYAYYRGLLTGAIREVLVDLPGYKKWVGRAFRFEPTRANVEHLKEGLPDASWSKDFAPIFQRIEEVKATESQTLALKAGEGLPPEALHFPYKTKPYAHQEAAFIVSRDQKVFGLFMDMGTGKTKVVIDSMAYLFGAGRIQGAVIVAPNGVHRQWLDHQIPAHLPDWVDYKALAYSSHHTKAFLREWKALVAPEPGKLAILTLGIQSLSSKKGVNFLREFLLAHQPALGAVDESTRIKNASAKRTKALFDLKPLMEWRRILSGAPITQGVEDLYAQMLFLSEDILGFKSFYTFRNRYCEMSQVPGAPLGAMQITGYKRTEELISRVQAHTYRVTKDECLDLPEKVYAIRTVSMTKEQTRIYNDLKDDFLAVISEGHTLEALEAGVRFTRLQQVVCGHLPSEDGTSWVEIPSNRIASTLEFYEDLKAPLVIWARYRSDLAQLAKAFKQASVKFVEYHGGVAYDERQNAVRAFSEGSVPIFLGNPDAAGTGVDGLQRVCSNALYFSNSFNADTRWQSEDRIHRIGQTGHATYTDLSSPGTLDPAILRALRKKKQVADSIIDPGKAKPPPQSHHVDIVGDLLSEAMGDAAAIFGGV